jgi:RimK family alpha-L-glutamate ligase
MPHSPDGIARRAAPPALRIALVSDRLDWHARELIKALAAAGARATLVRLEDCRFETGRPHGLHMPGFDERLPDAVFVRCLSGGSFEAVTVRLGLLHALRESGVAVINDARAIERCVDKSMTSFLLARAGIRSPDTWVTEQPAVARRIVEREAANGPLVLKPLFGSQGKGLQLVGEVNGVHHTLPMLSQGHGSLAYLQRFVPPVSTPGFDWRVLVVGGRAVTAMRRVSENWIHNVAQGARCEPAELTPELAQLAEQAAHALDMDYAGVDLIPSAQGTQVIEVNGVAAWRGLQRVTGFNIARAIVDDLLDRKCAAHRALDDEAAERRA